MAKGRKRSALSQDTEHAEVGGFLLFRSRIRVEVSLTGQVPPVMIRSKDKASGIPKDTLEPSELTVEPPIDCLFSSSKIDERAEST